MCANFGCGPTVVSKKVGYRQTDKWTLQLYIVDRRIVVAEVNVVAILWLSDMDMTTSAHFRNCLVESRIMNRLFKRQARNGTFAY